MLLDSSLDEQRAYMQSKAYDLPIITQMARGYGAIPAISAPSERVFSVLIAKKRTKISQNMLYLRSLHISRSRLRGGDYYGQIVEQG